MMKNKEAIEYLRNHTKYYEPVNREAFRVIEEALEKLEDYEQIFNESLIKIRKKLKLLEEIRKTLKVQKEETINQNLYWLYIEDRPILITRKIYDSIKEALDNEN